MFPHYHIHSDIFSSFKYSTIQLCVSSRESVNMLIKNDLTLSTCSWGWMMSREFIIIVYSLLLKRVCLYTEYYWTFYFQFNKLYFQLLYINCLTIVTCVFLSEQTFHIPLYATKKAFVFLCNWKFFWYFIIFYMTLCFIVNYMRTTSCYKS